MFLFAVALTMPLFAQQDSISIKLSTSELIELLELKRTIETEKEIEREEDSLINLNRKGDYVNLLLFKQRKNIGYRNKQAFEDKKRYAMLEKGVSFASFDISASSNDISDYLLEPIAVIDELYNRAFSGSISAGHFISNNTALAARFSYSFSETNLKVSADILDLLIGANTYETNNAKNTYSGAVGVRNYIPLDPAHRFFIVSETNLSYSYVEGISKNIYDEGVSTTKVLTHKDMVGVGLRPGFMYFMSRGFAFEFSMSPVAAYWSRTRTVNNEVDEGSVDSYGLSFKFMPLNIGFGFSYYFGLDYDKNRSYLKKHNIY